jgi:hypothetical protein
MPAGSALFAAKKLPKNETRRTEGFSVRPEPAGKTNSGGGGCC